MQKPNFFLNFIRADLRRLRGYLPSLFLSAFLLLFLCSLTGIYLSKHLYQENTFENINIAYYLPEDEDGQYTRLALDMLVSMNSMKESVNLFAVASPEEGYRMLDSGDILYLIIVPEHFLSGILDSTNTPLDIVVKDHSGIQSYIVNELFLSYAKYLGIAQAAVYSALDTMRSAGFSGEQISSIQDRVNITYLNRALNKEDYIEQKSAAAEGSHSLLCHYLASALMLTLFFLSIVIMPFLQRYPSGIRTRLISLDVSFISLAFIRFLSCLTALYAAFLPCFVCIEIFYGSFHAIGLLKALLPISGVALTVTLIALLCENTFTANIVTLFITLFLAYVGGGILPEAMLPKIVQDISPLLPGRYLISGFANALF